MVNAGVLAGLGQSSAVTSSADEVQYLNGAIERNVGSSSSGVTGLQVASFQARVGWPESAVTRNTPFCTGLLALA